MSERFSRLEKLVGSDNIERLSQCKVAVFGVGGVGGYVVEALVRSGIGYIDIYDHDVVSESNLNRQIIATHQTIGLKKIDVMKKRILSINPDCNVKGYDMFYLPENADDVDLTQYDYVVDAIDTITSKIELAIRCQNNHISLISCMGTGNKMDPSLLEVSDIYQTSVCPLARVMRRELKARGIQHLNVVYSKEKPIQVSDRTPGSTAFVPSSAGLLIASQVIKELMEG